jgi:hypothetical protein
VKKHAIQSIRQTLATLTEQKRQVKTQIQALKFDASGNRKPETGPERDELWRSYVWSVRPLARAAHLALGFLRGTPYLAMEPKCAEDDPPPLYGVLKALEKACGEDEALKVEWTLQRLRKLVEEAPMAQEAA